MELSEPAIVTPNDELIAAHSRNAGAAVDRFFTNVKSELYDKGFRVDDLAQLKQITEPTRCRP